MKRYNVWSDFVKHEESPEGEWMRADEVLPRIAELEAEVAAMNEQFAALKAWIDAEIAGAEQKLAAATQRNAGDAGRVAALWMEAKRELAEAEKLAAREDEE